MASTQNRLSMLKRLDERAEAAMARLRPIRSLSPMSSAERLKMGRPALNEAQDALTAIKGLNALAETRKRLEHAIERTEKVLRAQKMAS